MRRGIPGGKASWFYLMENTNKTRHTPGNRDEFEGIVSVSSSVNLFSDLP
jgi:hypothetical protein